MNPIIMNTYYTHQRNTYTFNVTKSDVNQRKALLPALLYSKMELTVLNSLTSLKEKNELTQHVFKLDMFKNARLKDRLKITHAVRKLSPNEILISVKVSKENSPNNELVCAATFGYTLKRKEVLHMAS